MKEAARGSRFQTHDGRDGRDGRAARGRLLPGRAIRFERAAVTSAPAAAAIGRAAAPRRRSLARAARLRSGSRRGVLSSAV